MKTYLPNYLKDRKLVFDLFREKRELTRSETADQLEMSFPTTIKSVNRLLELGIIKEIEEKQPSTGAGRRGHKLRFCPESFLAAGVTFEGRYAGIGLVDLDGNVLSRQSIMLAPISPETDLREAAEALRSTLASVPSDRILGIGLGFPAVIDPNTAEIIHLDSMNIHKPVPFTEQFPCFRMMEGYPIYLDNDVNIACAGEAFLRGKIKECRDLVYLSLGTGCGSAILMDGNLWRGNHFRSGEIGGFRLKTDEKSATGFEDRVNLHAISKKFHINLGEDPSPSPDICREICAYLAPYLGLLLYDLSSVLDIDRYVLSGVIPKSLGDGIFREVRHALDRTLPAGQSLTVEPSVSENAGIVGAAMQVFDYRMEELLGN